MTVLLAIEVQRFIERPRVRRLNREDTPSRLAHTKIDTFDLLPQKYFCPTQTR
jgi:hypothetical protein